MNVLYGAIAIIAIDGTEVARYDTSTGTSTTSAAENYLPTLFYSNTAVDSTRAHNVSVTFGANAANTAGGENWLYFDYFLVIGAMYVITIGLATNLSEIFIIFFSRQRGDDGPGYYESINSAFS